MYSILYTVFSVRTVHCASATLLCNTRRAHSKNKGLCHMIFLGIMWCWCGDCTVHPYSAHSFVFILLYRSNDRTQCRTVYVQQYSTTRLINTTISGPAQFGYFNRVAIYSTIYTKQNFGDCKNCYNKRLVILTAVTISGFHCKWVFRHTVTVRVYSTLYIVYSTYRTYCTVYSIVLIATGLN